VFGNVGAFFRSGPGFRGAKSPKEPAPMTFQGTFRLWKRGVQKKRAEKIKTLLL